MNFLRLVLLILVVIMGVAYLTLLERNILGYIQNRKGPNKVGLMGIFQPFRDAIKLLRKEIVFVYKSNYNLYFSCNNIYDDNNNANFVSVLLLIFIL